MDGLLLDKELEMMRFDRRSWIAVACAALGAIVCVPALADEYDETVANFRKAQETSKFFGNAHGYAVFPTIGKAGVGIGGAHGKGRVYEKGKYIGDATMNQASIGFQLGAQGYSEMIFFENEDALKKFTAGDFQFSADASAVALTLGANASTGTGGTTAGAGVNKEKSKVVGAYNNGMVVFTVAKGGLMYEASLAGQKYKFTKKAE